MYIPEAFRSRACSDTHVVGIARSWLISAISQMIFTDAAFREKKKVELSFRENTRENKNEIGI